MSRSSRKQVHLVTQARTPRSEDIGHRERRYLIMMAVRVACFLAAILMVANGAGWLAAFPAVGAIVIPYIAVVFANGGREPNDTRGFREFQPNLPDVHPSPSVPGPGGRPGAPDMHAAPPSGDSPGPAHAPTGAPGRQGPSAGVQSGAEKRDGNG